MVSADDDSESLGIERWNTKAPQVFINQDMPGKCVRQVARVPIPCPARPAEPMLLHVELHLGHLPSKSWRALAQVMKPSSECHDFARGSIRTTTVRDNHPFGLRTEPLIPDQPCEFACVGQVSVQR